MFKKNLVAYIFLFIVLISVFPIIKTPMKQVFEYDPDEGTELIKSALYLNRFSLYKEIWDDQPPLFTVILSFWFKPLKPSVYHGRILILIFSGVLLFAFYQILKGLWGDSSAFIAVLLLIFSSLYLRLSVSIMLEIPMLAFAMLSIYCVTIYGKCYLRRFLALSGIFMAFSLQTKLFTAFLAPLILLEIFQINRLAADEKRPKGLSSCVSLWLGSFLTVYIFIVIIFSRFNFVSLTQQLIQSHLEKLVIPYCDFSAIWNLILADYDILLLALIGILLLVRQKKWLFLFPVLWLVSALIILIQRSPVWDQYYIVVSIPMCWLTAVSINEVFRADFPYGKGGVFLSWLTAAILILSILRLPEKYNRTYRNSRSITDYREPAVAELLKKYKPYTRWIVTDKPVFAFSAGMLVPPELAVISETRNFARNPGQQYFIDKLKKYNPELILLNKRKYYGERILSYIEKGYSKIYLSPIFYAKWVPGYIYRKLRYLNFLNRRWLCRVPVLKAGYFMEVKSKETALELYLRNDIKH